MVHRSKRGFFPLKLNRPSAYTNIILQLLEEYDCSSIGLISSVSFNQVISETDRFYLIGWVFGEDPLAIDKINEEIVTLPFWDYDSINFHCGVNGESFLDAFLIGGIPPFCTNFEDRERQDLYTKGRAEEATLAAGGEKYLKFWKSLYAGGMDTTEDKNVGGLWN